MELSSQQLALLRRLLDEALPLDVEARRRWLDGLAPEHQFLADALRSALLSEGTQSHAAGPQAIDTSTDSDRSGSGLRPGEMVGPYQLTRLLGEGGMAEVWLARRADGAFKRDVALKLPLLLRLRKDLESRFVRERDILAALEHSNIARLYDAGVSSNGLPYLAMEYVAGESLTEWCDARRLGIRARLKLFLQVLDAVQYAHAQGVIHRDIKPSNILVTPSGQIRLLDFGVAKLLAQEPEQTELTQRYGRVLTPGYASPELVRGEALDVASDIYALGVVLYELLSGSKPYQLAGGTIAQLEQAITTVEVQRPSRQLGQGAAEQCGTTERKLARQLRGDLDAIILKALAKAPAGRYASATDFADDLQRYLSGEPVEARPDRLSYRSAKWLSRHRAASAVTVAATVLVAGSLAYISTHPRGLDTLVLSGSIPPDRAGSPGVPQEKSIAVLPFADMSRQKNQEYFSDGLSEELIDHLVHSADLKVIARSSSFQFKGKNEDVRSIAHQLGVTHLLEGSVRQDGQQLRITAQLIRGIDGVQLWSQSYDRSLVDIFRLQEEISDEVCQALRIALQNGRRPASPAPDIQAYNLVLEGNYFKARSSLRDVERAAQLYQQAIDIDPNYALAWARLASAYLDQEILQGESHDQSTRVLEAVNRAIHLDPNLVWAYYARAAFELNVTWDWAAAQADTRRMRDLDPRSDLLISALGDLEFMFGQVDKALELYQRELARNPLDAETLNSLGQALCAAHRLRECLQTQLKLAQLHPEFDGANYSVGIARLLLGQFPEALTTMQREPNEDYRLLGLAMVYSALQRRTESDGALNTLQEKVASHGAYGIAEVHAYRGELDDALRWLERAYRQHEAQIVNMNTDPLLQSLRSDPRFQALLVRLRLTEKPSLPEAVRS